jgi:hypothetical protein
MTKYYFITTSNHDADGNPQTKSIKADEVKTYTKLISLQRELQAIGYGYNATIVALGTFDNQKVKNLDIAILKIESQLTSLCKQLNLNKWDIRTYWRIACLELPDNVDVSKTKIFLI